MTHPAVANLLRWFRHEHLRDNAVKDVARAMGQLAHQVAGDLPEGPELTAGLRKLLEAKDCFVRAALPPEESS